MNRILFALFLATAVLGLTLNAAETQPALTKKQLVDLAANASTPADHLKLAAYYTQQAAAFTAMAKTHEEMKAGYQKNPAIRSSKFTVGLLDHCSYLITTSRNAADRSAKMAAMHEELAKAAEKK